MWTFRAIATWPCSIFFKLVATMPVDNSNIDVAQPIENLDLFWQEVDRYHANGEPVSFRTGYVLIALASPSLVAGMLGW
jgi:hypothetical protein